MSVSAMKQALEALDAYSWEQVDAARAALRQAIEQAEKQEGWVLREVYFSEGEPISHREPQWVGLTDEELPEGETYDFDRGVRWAERYLKQQIVASDYSNSHQQEPFAVAWVLDGELFWPSEYEVIAQTGDKAIPLYTAPVYAIDISQEPVDETEKDRHEFEQPDLARVGEVGVWGHQREWVGLTDQEIYDIREDHTYNDEEFNDWGFAKDIEAKLKEKNT